MSYKQLAQEQRDQIYALLKMGHKQTEIAAVIGMHKSTISRELGRNSGLRGYRPKQAHHKALSRRNHSRMRIWSETWELIEAKLRLDWSPEQVSGWLSRQHASQVRVQPMVRRFSAGFVSQHLDVRLDDFSNIEMPPNNVIRSFTIAKPCPPASVQAGVNISKCQYAPQFKRKCVRKDGRIVQQAS